MRASRARRATTAAVSTLFLLTLVAAPSLVGAQQPKHAGDSWIVSLHPDVDVLAQGAGMAHQAGGRIGLVYTHALNGFQLHGSAAAAEALRRNPNVLAVTPDYPVELTETLPFGIERIDAYIPGGTGAYQAGYRGNGARIAIIDTGVDMDHPDLVGAIDAASGKNCVNELLPPEDGHGHGTHVAGSAAAPLNGVGVVGVAAEATIIPVKMFNDAGQTTESIVLCAMNHVVGLNTDGNAANDVDVASMSWGESRAWGDCLTDPLRTAMCNASATGMVLVAGAGNSSADAGTFVPAAYPEVISVSAVADFDGDPGGLAGCGFVLDLFATECDDTFAFFSNRGPSVDVTAPGVRIYSTWKNGGYNTISGTSMATPHVSGVAALMRAANPALSSADVLALLRQSGECPNGAWADADGTAGCAGQGQWPDDPDGIAEPMVNALRAAQASGSPPPPGPPSAPVLGATAGDGVVTLTWSTPGSGGSPITGYVVYRGLTPGTAEEYANTGLTNTYPDTAVSNGSTYYYQVAAVNALGTSTRSNEASATPSPPPPPTPTPTPSPTPSPTPLPPLPWEQGPQGNWVGNFGADGYALLAWNSSTDLVSMPLASLVLDQGSRYRWSSGTTDVRALESPDESTRRAAQWFDNNTLRLHLTFNSAYTGTLHLYALDWDGNGRRQNVIVNDGSGAQTVNLSSSFNGGAWMHFPVSVAGGGTVTIRADRLVGQATLSGVFLGGGGVTPTPTPSPTPTPTPDPIPTPVPTPPPTPTPVPTPSPTPIAPPVPTPTPAPSPPGWEQAPQGDWVGSFGADGYLLMAWNKTSDLSSLGGATATLDQGSRYRWSASTQQARALENPGQTQRRAAQWVHATSLRFHLTFPAGYSGTLHLYALDWDGTSRRQAVIVDDGMGPQTVSLTTSFNGGAWMHFPITVTPGGTVSVRVDKTAGNATLSGLFLGGP